MHRKKEAIYQIIPHHCLDRTKTACRAVPCRAVLVSEAKKAPIEKRGAADRWISGLMGLREGCGGWVCDGIEIRWICSAEETVMRRREGQ
ncbi:hypothetical protein VNO78_27134 [Psophocarpus tetragonolobus]|uniref:Uncharacterized protein n=1 Tax=Psophocarpus tetragonolobus TaxID=3891 RepID=A0AAN9S0A0_PSOTE